MFGSGILVAKHFSLMDVICSGIFIDTNRRDNGRCVTNNNNHFIF